MIHKIGVTGGKVEARISGADKDSTYLLAAVEVVATYNLHNINRVKMENLFHVSLVAHRLTSALMIVLAMQLSQGSGIYFHCM